MSDGLVKEFINTARLLTRAVRDKNWTAAFYTYANYRRVTDIVFVDKRLAALETHEFPVSKELTLLFAAQHDHRLGIFRACDLAALFFRTADDPDPNVQLAQKANSLNTVQDIYYKRFSTAMTTEDSTSHLGMIAILIRIHAQLHHPDATRFLQIAHSLSYDDPRIVIARVEFKIHNNNFGEAIELLATHLKPDGCLANDPDAHLLLARVLIKDGQKSQAEEFLTLSMADGQLLRDNVAARRLLIKARKRRPPSLQGQPHY